MDYTEHYSYLDKTWMLTVLCQQHPFTHLPEVVLLRFILVWVVGVWLYLRVDENIQKNLAKLHIQCGVSLRGVRGKDNEKRVVVREGEVS